MPVAASLSRRHRPLHPHLSRAPYRRPRANLLTIVSNGIGAGHRSAIAAAVGVECGTLVHLAAAVVGLSAALGSSALAFPHLDRQRPAHRQLTTVTWLATPAHLHATA